ncbi:MAG: hypothetical protein ACO1N9_07190 [Flavobacterium sp.]
MEQQFDLDAFTKALTDKGYDRYFVTQADYSGKLKDSISNFLDACANGKDKQLYPNMLPLNTYLEWDGEDKPKVSCQMWVRYEDGKFNVQKMSIERTDQYGNSIKKSELTNLTTASVPTRKEALVLVAETPKQQLTTRNRRFKL